MDTSECLQPPNRPRDDRDVGNGVGGGGDCKRMDFLPCTYSRMLPPDHPSHVPALLLRTRYVAYARFAPLLAAALGAVARDSTDALDRAKNAEARADAAEEKARALEQRLARLEALLEKS